MTSREIHIATVQGFTAEFSAWAGDYADDYDWDAIRADYNAELDKLAPEGVTWGWTEQGVYCYADLDVNFDDIHARWAEIIDEELIDFENIAAKHDKTQK